MRRAEFTCVATLGLLLALVATADLRADRPAGARPAKGMFLVASPRMMDPNFARTVILLTGYGPDGAMGLVVNRPTDVSLSHVVPDFSELPRSDERLFVGGPVARNGILFLVRAEAEPQDSFRVLDDVYVSRSHELLKQLVGDADATRSFRVFSGYAGWAPGQLDAELARGDWLVKEGDADAVFFDDERLWRHLLPPDPSWSAGRRHDRYRLNPS